MAFSSIEFLFYFLPIFFLLYFLAPGTSGKNVVLLLASLLFYAAGEPRFVLVLVAQMALNYAAALVIARAEGFRRVATAIGVSANLLLLSAFKYAGFVVSTLNGIVHTISRGAVTTIPHPNLALPIGISFFTFHSISYLIDVYRKQVLPNRSPIEIAIYIAMFPQLIAGPIVRYHTISHLLGRRRSTIGRASAGMRIFIIGLAQKVLIADEVAKIAERVFDYTIHPTATEAWLGLGAYTLQIYFDFAGYSSMAVGLGFMLGFAFPRNFRLPYTSELITEFWRRWHISLSQWLRDYLYIPLGGSRGTNPQTYRNLWLVFLSCGIWHGANWTFVIWGIHHGSFLIAERAGLAKILSRAPLIVRRSYVMLVAMTGWVWFRAHSTGGATLFFGSLVGVHGWSAWPAIHLLLYPTTLGAMVIGAALALLRIDVSRLVRRQLAAVGGATAWPPIDSLAIAALLAFSLLTVASSSYSPFLYFRF